MVKNEKDFVLRLKKYTKENKDSFSNIEIYLLRNYHKSGEDFQLQWSGFYPDFIMWIKPKDKQIMVFIDSHGLEHEKAGLNNEKIKFAGFIDKNDTETIHIKQIEKELNKKYKKDILLESFILSTTSYQGLI